MKKAINLLSSPNDSRFMMEQMKSDNPCYGEVKDLQRQAIVYAYHYRSFDFHYQLNLLWKYCFLLDGLGSMPSAQKSLKLFVLTYAKFLVREYPSKFKLSSSSVETYFSKIAKYERLDYVKKVIQGLYFNAKSNVELTDEMKEFVNE